ncbi:MAG: 2,4-dienoyl-CoA reductase-like NADH-dependent reductase (Old Yellow Enzyme family) [Halioglobus sp.]|jgi:2,4-dienoyl-CoA reductase-like NADH-dependent reductase (Old Yellow Enzyme family)
MYKHLMSGAQLADLELRNRIIMTPMGTNLAEEDGHCGDRIQAYYEARARGGAGMLIMGVGAIAWPEGACNPNQVAISDDRFLPGLSELARRVKRHGCRAAIQLQHAGKVAVCDIAAGRPMLVPSVPPGSRDELTAALTPQELASFVRSYTQEGARIEYKVASKTDLEALIEQFASAAERAKRAGFEGVEIHAGHGYIISEFLSPHVNKRDDEYGGVLENRARLLLEVLRATKAAVGLGFPVWCRLDSLEFRLEGGICFEDAVKTAVLAEQAGADAVHVSAYANPSSGVAFTEAPLVHEPGGYLKFAAGMKAKLSIPVIAVGRIELEVADRVIAAGEADFIAMGRKLLADPELPNKLARGEPEKIRPCIYCYSCVSRIFVNDHVRCAVNAQTGFEATALISPAAAPLHLLVVGGGPGGMEAARVAALRGHRVTLAEQGSVLGGTALFAAVAYAPNGDLVRYLVGQMECLNVAIQLNTRVDQSYLEKLRPDKIIVASGAVRETPPIPGAERNHVFSGDELRALMMGGGYRAVRSKLGLFSRALMLLADVLGITVRPALLRPLSKVWMPLGRQVCIVGGGLVGVELAQFLAERGRQVSVVEEGGLFGVELSLVRRWRVLEELKQLGVVMINKAQVVCIKHKSLVLRIEGAEVDITADTVILASGACGDLTLSDMCQALGYDVRSVGDCAGVAYIEGAIRSGNEAGRAA